MADATLPDPPAARSFSPCRGKTACRDDGARCLTCDRDFAEIAGTRALIDTLAAFALQQGYADVETFAAYVAEKAVNKVRYWRGGKRPWTRPTRPDD